MSQAANAPDLRPNRLACMLQAARDFVRNFFDQVGLMRVKQGGERGCSCPSARDA